VYRLIGIREFPWVPWESRESHVYPPHLFTVLIPYLVKIMIHLAVFTLF